MSGLYAETVREKPIMKNKDLSDEENMDRDDVVNRGNDGHPVATGVGALGGAAAGAAVGTAVGGPVGTVVGAVIGAVTGGVGGYAVGEAVDPAAEDAYWRENHTDQPFAKSGRYEDTSRRIARGMKATTGMPGRGRAGSPDRVRAKRNEPSLGQSARCNAGRVGTR